MRLLKIDTHKTQIIKSIHKANYTNFVSMLLVFSDVTMSHATLLLHTRFLIIMYVFNINT